MGGWDDAGLDRCVEHPHRGIDAQLRTLDRETLLREIRGVFFKDGV
jgi:hypothetical protein